MNSQWTIVLSSLGAISLAIIAAAALVWLFRVLFGLGAKGGKQSADSRRVVSGQAAAGQSPLSSAVSAPMEGGALIAVITAAIAANTGASPGSFRIASVSPSYDSESGFNTPVWGRVERFAHK